MKNPTRKSLQLICALCCLNTTAFAEDLVLANTYNLASAFSSSSSNFHPQGLGFDEAANELLYMQQSTNIIYRSDLMGNLVGQRTIGRILLNPGGSTDPRAHHTTSVAADGSNYYFSDYTCNSSCYDLHVIDKVSGMSSNLSVEIGSSGGYPIDVRGGIVYRTEFVGYNWSPLNEVRVASVMSPDSIMQTLILAGTNGIGDLAVDVDGGNIWILEYTGSARIHQYDINSGVLQDTWSFGLEGTTAGLTYGNGRLYYYDWVSGAGSTLSVYDVVRGAIVRTVDAAATNVPRGGTGYPVTVTVENTGMNLVNVTGGITLAFTGSADRTSEYTVTPDPGNPTSIAPGVTATFTLAVDVDPMATLETITIDGGFTGMDAVTGRLVGDPTADVTDTWDVNEAVTVRVVDAVAAQVSRGGLGYTISASVENLGANAIGVTSIDFNFTGSADRTSEYSVAADPGNPVMIAVGATENFAFTVDVDTMATLETITLDAGFLGMDMVTGFALGDPDADVTDFWDVVDTLEVLAVDAIPMTVSQGSTANPVQVVVRNLGTNDLDVVSIDLSFTGSADRTSEYTVTPGPMNPTVLVGGAVDTFLLNVDVDPAATSETVVIDASFEGNDRVTGGTIIDPDAFARDSWVVMACGVVLCGDCNSDGMLSILDALTAAQHSAGLITLTGPSFTNCNVIGALEPSPGAAVSITDALTIAQFVAGLPVAMVCC